MKQCAVSAWAAVAICLYGAWVANASNATRSARLTAEAVNSRAAAAAPSPYMQAAQQKEDFAKNGLMILRSVFGKEDLHACRQYLDDVIWAHDLSRRPDIYGEITGEGIYADTSNSVVRGNRFWLPTAPMSIRNMTYRLIGTQLLPAPNPLRRLTDDINILAVARELIGGHISTISGLVFERGTQQALHEDTWYGLAGRKQGGMVGVWFALEDVDDGNGPLLYVPKSHIERPERNYSERFSGQCQRPHRLQITSEVVRDLAYKEAREYLPKAIPLRIRAGDVAFWHERLLHGGAKIQDVGRTRLSMVFHYRNIDLPRPRRSRRTQSSLTEK